MSHAEALHRTSIQRGRIKLITVASTLLGLIQRDAGIFDERLTGFGVLGKNGDTDTRGDKNFAVVELKRLLHSRDKVCRYHRAVFDTTQRRQENVEFISANARD